MSFDFVCLLVLFRERLGLNLLLCMHSVVTSCFANNVLPLVMVL